MTWWYLIVLFWLFSFLFLRIRLLSFLVSLKTFVFRPPLLVIIKQNVISMSENCGTFSHSPYFFLRSDNGYTSGLVKAVPKMRETYLAPPFSAWSCEERWKRNFRVHSSREDVQYNNRLFRLHREVSYIIVLTMLFSWLHNVALTIFQVLAWCGLLGVILLMCLSTNNRVFARIIFILTHWNSVQYTSVALTLISIFYASLNTRFVWIDDTSQFDVQLNRNNPVRSY